MSEATMERLVGAVTRLASERGLRLGAPARDDRHWSVVLAFPADEGAPGWHVKIPKADREARNLDRIVADAGSRERAVREFAALEWFAQNDFSQGDPIVTVTPVAFLAEWNAIVTRTERGVPLWKVLHGPAAVAASAAIGRWLRRYHAASPGRALSDFDVRDALLDGERVVLLDLGPAPPGAQPVTDAGRFLASMELIDWGTPRFGLRGAPRAPAHAFLDAYSGGREEKAREVREAAVRALQDHLTSTRGRSAIHRVYAMAWGELVIRRAIRRLRASAGPPEGPS